MLVKKAVGTEMCLTSQNKLAPRQECVTYSLLTPKKRRDKENWSKNKKDRERGRGKALVSQDRECWTAENKAKIPTSKERHVYISDHDASIPHALTPQSHRPPCWCARAHTPRAARRPAASRLSVRLVSLRLLAWISKCWPSRCSCSSRAGSDDGAHQLHGRRRGQSKKMWHNFLLSS
jgi:hypothetical protein